MSTLFVGDLIVREVRTMDEHVKGAVRKFEVVNFYDAHAFEPLFSAFTEDEAYKEAANMAASL